MSTGAAGLSARYSALVCDLDGVVYRGEAPVPHAVESLVRVDQPIQYATNNASRPPSAVAEHLSRLGVSCGPGDVATSAQAGAWILRERLAEGARVLAIGGPGVAAALEGVGLHPVAPADRSHDVAAVLQGYGASVSAAELGEAAYAIQGGAVWVATNTDATLPTDRGVAPGNGSLVAAVGRACGRDPDAVAGKPEPPLYLLCAQRLGLEPGQVLAVGDRLDTDIEGAVAAGLDSLLVLTGVDDLDACLAAPAHRRPTYVVPDLRALHDDPETPDGDRPPLRALWDAIAAAWSAGDCGADESVTSARRRHADDVLAGLLRR